MLQCIAVGEQKWGPSMAVMDVTVKRLDIPQAATTQGIESSPNSLTEVAEFTLESSFWEPSPQ